MRMDREFSMRVWQAANPGSVSFENRTHLERGALQGVAPPTARVWRLEQVQHIFGWRNLPGISCCIKKSATCPEQHLLSFLPIIIVWITLNLSISCTCTWLS